MEKGEQNITNPSANHTPQVTGPSGADWAGYKIRIKDHLETYWYEWFDGWTISNLENGEVLLSSNHVDHSALHGALNKIRDLNLTLLSVTRFSSEKGPS